jgi:hypothetical protein
VNDCDLMLVLIGESWISVKDARGRRRLDDPHDFVGVEIAAVLERDIPVIPVLIQGATMPTQADLPARMQGLARRNALEMSDSHWNDDWEMQARRDQPPGGRSRDLRCALAYSPLPGRSVACDDPLLTVDAGGSVPRCAPAFHPVT